MRVNDKDIKNMMSKVNDIHLKTKVIEVKLGNIEEHIKTQNGKVSKNQQDIENLKVNQEGLKTKVWFLSAALGVTGGFIGMIGGYVVRVMLGG